VAATAVIMTATPVMVTGIAGHASGDRITVPLIPVMATGTLSTVRAIYPSEVPQGWGLDPPWSEV